MDATGRAYILGQTDSFDFPVAAALQARHAGRTDAFISVLDPAGAHLVWSTYFGGSQDDWPSAMALDSSGDIHLVGWTYSPDFPLRQAAQTRDGRQGDAFVAKVKGDGSAVTFSTFLGGSDIDFANAVATDIAGNTYVAGITYSKDLPTVNAIQSALTGAPNALVVALNGQTGKLQYATYLGGSGRDNANAIAADAAGNAYIAGDTTSADFPTRYAFQPAIGTCPAGVPFFCVNQDAFLARIGVS